MRQRLRPAVVVDDGKGRAGDRVGAAKTLCKALGESGLARTQPAGKVMSAPGASTPAIRLPSATVSAREWVIYSDMKITSFITKGTAESSAIP